MAWIEGRTAKDVKAALAKLSGPVKLVYFTGAVGCETCGDGEALYRELTGLSERLTLEVRNQRTEPELAARYGVERVPALVLEGPAGARVRFYGLPAGYEFVSLLQALADAADGAAKIRPDTRERLKALTAPMHIQVFVTPTCPYCPPAVRTAHKLATVFPQITADMIEATEFPELAAKHQVRGVPHVVLNGGASFDGAEDEAGFVDAVLAAAQAGAA